MLTIGQDLSAYNKFQLLPFKIKSESFFSAIILSLLKITFFTEPLLRPLLPLSIDQLVEFERLAAFTGADFKPSSVAAKKKNPSLVNPFVFICEPLLPMNQVSFISYRERSATIIPKPLLK